MLPLRLLSASPPPARTRLRPFLSYALTGALATALHYSLLMLLVEQFGMAPAWGAGLGALCGAAAAYVGNRRLAFQDSPAPHRQALPRFAAVALLSAVLNSAIVGLGSTVLKQPYLLAQAVATLLMLGLSYQLNRRWSFA